MGVFGKWGESGPVPMGWRVIGLFILIESVAYFIPNSWLIEHPLRLKTYLCVTVLPIVGILIAIIMTVSTEADLLCENVAVIVGWSVGFALAPMSALLYASVSRRRECKGHTCPR